MDRAKAKQEQDAAQRIAARAQPREETKTKLEHGGILEANDDERIALREEHLAELYGHGGTASKRAFMEVGIVAPREADAGASDDPDTAGANPGPETGGRRADGRLLEAVVNTSDFLGINYLDSGVEAQRAVGRVRIYSPEGDLLGYGTGFLVSPRLLLTNNHVLPTKDEAAASKIEFNYQDGPGGLPLQPVLFDLDPETFYLTDEHLDFSLVAVGAGEEDLRPFGFLQLIGKQGKLVLGEFVTIVQHPGGGPKQIALRDNRVVDMFDDFVHYETDTKRGSSGSACKNDQWEVVALHHASVPARDGRRYINEGTRVSSIVRFIREAPLDTPEARTLREALLVVGGNQRRRDEGNTGVARPGGKAGAVGAGDALLEAAVEPVVAGTDTVTMTVPLEFTIRIGTPGAPHVRVAIPSPGRGEPARADTDQEAISIDPDYGNRRGYDPDFLGHGESSVPLPKLTDEMIDRAAVNRETAAGPRYLLPYHHYSVVMNAERRLAFFTAVNIDGSHTRRIRRDPDRWIRDPRIPANQQTDNGIYARNDLDRGHLVRRLDPAWGPTERIAKVANDDTFHFPNCSPQHKDFNQNRTTWAGLEDYILENADNRDFKVTVFTGPVLDDEVDFQYRGIQLPLQFWKVVVMTKRSGALSATAYLLSQAALLVRIEREALRVAPETFHFGAYKNFQVPISQIEQLTGLGFGNLNRYDPLAGLERTAGSRRVVERLSEVQL